MARQAPRPSLPPERRPQERASGGSRTHNPRITNAVLCRLKLRWHSFRLGAALIRYVPGRPSARNQVSLRPARKSVKSRSSLDLWRDEGDRRTEEPKNRNEISVVCDLVLLICNLKKTGVSDVQKHFGKREWPGASQPRPQNNVRDPTGQPER